MSVVTSVDTSGERRLYRADIQGLRGVAVLSVVLYHARTVVSGGFLGVDVFFVISGYIVTTQLIRQVESEGRFDLAAFFSRRIRRLIPIYALVVIACIPLTLVFLSPFGEQQSAFSTSMWSAGLAANYQLMLDDSYQALVSNPFRHLWSLSVEEQFYVLLPILLAVLMPLRRRRGIRSGGLTVALVAVVAVSLVSLLLSLVLARSGADSVTSRFAFFAMPTRLWELGAGVALALGTRVRRPNPSSLREASGLAALVLLTVCLLVGDERWHPGPSAVLVVGATVVLLWAGSASRFLEKALGRRELVFLGDVSYGWYLWHWPLIVFAALVWPSNFVALLLVSVAALVLAFITYRFVENPIRRSERIRGWRSATVLVGSALLILSLSATGGRLADTGLGLGDVDQIDFDFTREFDLDRRGENMDGACFLRALPASLTAPLSLDRTLIERRCSNGQESDSVDVLLLGDSMALSASDGLFLAASSAGLRAVALTAAGCPTLASPPIHNLEGCRSVQDEFRRFVSELDPRIVVLVNRLDLYVNPMFYRGENDYRLPEESREPRPDFDRSLDRVVHSLADFVDDVRAPGRTVVVKLQPPVGVVVDRTLLEKWIPQTALVNNPRLSELVAQWAEIRTRVSDALASLPDVVLLDPAQAICGRSDFCPVETRNAPLYGDLTHLNPSGSRRLVSEFQKLLQIGTRTSAAR